MLDHYSVDASQGGGHNGNNLYPSLSLSEGFATWFAAACLKNPNYLSTVGLPPKQQLNFSNYNIENIDNIPYRSFGIQSEFTVSEILWDIYDGSEDYSIDSDNDGIQINFDDIMHIFQLFRKQKDYPFLITFLDRLKDNNFLTELEISNLLQSPTDQYIEYPYPVVWPFQMELEMAYPIDGNPYFIGIPESGTIESESYLFSGSFFLNQFWSFFINKPLVDIVITFGVKEEGISQILKLELYTIDNIFITAKQCKSGQYIQINESLLKGSYIIKIIAYDNNIEQYGRYWLSVEEN
ncbi:MAG: hypothetical protein OMM_12524 [Candidatus Magnetoglobus multicellularis str. Araruama]|uniref:Uncharacterized protein n=1 Tax=Candidatus Magnetoglobus multicellularis str. Araruama TaxID=890399 RepID=A0A1V1NVM2_9BACT|nr:MAG: hypothetical protein OMM_12524 [Candidatus Magnetoglobus multicellularis str. Araruama]